MVRKSRKSRGGTGLFAKRARSGWAGLKNAGANAASGAINAAGNVKQGWSDATSSYDATVAANKEKAAAAESYTKFKTALPTVMQEGGRRTRRRRTRRRRKSRKGRRRRKRRRTRRRRRKKRTKRRRRR